MKGRKPVLLTLLQYLLSMHVGSREGSLFGIPASHTCIFNGCADLFLQRFIEILLCAGHHVECSDDLTHKSEHLA